MAYGIYCMLYIIALHCGQGGLVVRQTIFHPEDLSSGSLCGGLYEQAVNSVCVPVFDL